MKYKILIKRNLLSRLNPSVKGLTLYPFILLRHHHLKMDAVLINHEKIHLRQQLELLVLPFYLLYILNYAINLVRYRSHFKAYRQIIFEREAYNNEQNLDYLKNRPLFAFLKYVKKPS